jgi:hypothetical protein
MYTSIVMVALVGFVPQQAESEGPTWLTNYSQARKQGQKESRPLAVFVGSGERGYEKVCGGGKLSPEARRLLAANYLCVYLDTETTEGQRVASLFQMANGTGLVISDRSGDYQSCRFNGTLTDAELTRSLKRFAAPNHVANTTVTNVNEHVSYYPPQQTNGTTYPAGTSVPATYAPATYAPPTYVPASYGTFGGFGGFGGGRGC